MGGSGSGHWYRWDKKETTEGKKKIDIRWMKKHGYLRPGMSGSLSWSSNGEQTGSISYWMETGRMILNYRHRSYGEDWQPVQQEVFFDWTSCNYGGKRTWFLCPQCTKRVAIIYGAGKLFLCRHCYNLSYSSQQEGRADRMMRKARKIRRQLNNNGPSLMEPILFKPKHMHQKTFDRLRREAEHANALGWQIMGQKLGFDYSPFL